MWVSIEWIWGFITYMIAQCLKFTMSTLSKVTRWVLAIVSHSKVKILLKRLVYVPQILSTLIYESYLFFGLHHLSFLLCSVAFSIESLIKFHFEVSFIFFIRCILQKTWIFMPLPGRMTQYEIKIMTLAFDFANI